MKRKKDPAILEAFFSLWFFSFSSVVTHALPWPIKWEAGNPIKEEIQIHTRPNHEIKTQEHDMSTRLNNDQALSTRSFLSLRDLGSFFSLACL
jgi:hypothetical protein